MSTHLDPKSAVSLATKFLAPLPVEADLDDRDHLLLLCIDGVPVDTIERKYWATHEDLYRLCGALRRSLI